MHFYPDQACYLIICVRVNIAFAKQTRPSKQRLMVIMTEPINITEEEEEENQLSIGKTVNGNPSP